MLILKYFNRTPAIVQDQGLLHLLEPTCSLSTFVPYKAIELANTEVEKVKNKGPCTSPPFVLPSQTCPATKLHYVLQSMFSEIFSLGEFHNLPNFLLPTCSCNDFAKFSCYQSFPPYGS